MIDKTFEKPVQTEMPFAIVQGEHLTELPKDLYIPPVALEVFLDAFEGPLDLLLYLIRKQNLDVLDIPIADITEQYVDYINLMHDLELSLAGEYLLMAAIMVFLKSKFLVNKDKEEDVKKVTKFLTNRLTILELVHKNSELLLNLPQFKQQFFTSTWKFPVTT